MKSQNLKIGCQWAVAMKLLDSHNRIIYVQIEAYLNPCFGRVNERDYELDSENLKNEQVLTNNERSRKGKAHINT